MVIFVCLSNLYFQPNKFISNLAPEQGFANDLFIFRFLSILVPLSFTFFAKLAFYDINLQNCNNMFKNVFLFKEFDDNLLPTVGKTSNAKVSLVLLKCIFL